MKKTYLLLCTFAAALAFANCSSDDGDDDDNGSGNVSSYTRCPDNHHPHAIDLGLPSGTKWACCNVGATKPEAGGDCFAWGETQPMSDDGENTYKWAPDDCEEEFTKYNSSDGKTMLEAEDDAATQNWGKRWRMPSIEEFQELLDNCDRTWTTMNGVMGYKFTSKKSSAFVFFPAAGQEGDDPDHPDEHGPEGLYWSSTLYPYGDYGDHAYFLYFYSSICYWYNDDHGKGVSVRAVCP